MIMESIQDKQQLELSHQNIKNLSKVHVIW